MPEQVTNTPEGKKEKTDASKTSIQATWKRWLNYQSIVKQVPFLFFLALLAVLYIYNGHYADKTIRQINRTTKEVKELRYEYIAVKSKVLLQGKQSELVKTEAIQQLGLKELETSPIVLKDEPVPTTAQ
ncbi:MAG: FtsL-like putative cell division protein [Bacteroidetes bacterium]|nr:FtsL-like putative cell division protein [Bacteroidota bacterium]